MGQPMVVSKNGFDSDDTYDLVYSNITFVNALRNKGVPDDRISSDAWLSYFVDYYRAEVDNGGFPQFVYNSRWNPKAVEMARRGMEAMGAIHHLAAFEHGAAIVDELGPQGLKRFLDSGYVGENNPERVALRGCMEDYYAAKEQAGEDLIALNAAWIRSRPDLKVLEMDAMYAELDRQVAAANPA